MKIGKYLQLGSGIILLATFLLNYGALIGSNTIEEEKTCLDEYRECIKLAQQEYDHADRSAKKYRDNNCPNTERECEAEYQETMKYHKEILENAEEFCLDTYLNCPYD